MKKKILCISVIALILAITIPSVSFGELPQNQTLATADVSLLSIQYGMVGYQEKTTETTTQKAQEDIFIPEPIPETSKIEKFEIEGRVTSEQEQEFIRDINDLPQQVIERYNSEGWTLCFTAKDIAKNYYDDPVEGSIAGLTDYGNRIIYISVSDSYPTFRHILFHEMGHFVDWCSDRTSHTEDFESIYNKETDHLSVQGKSKRQIAHGRSSVEEYYAEAFSKMLLGEDMGSLSETERVLKRNLEQI